MAPNKEEYSFSLKKVLPGIKMALNAAENIVDNKIKFTLVGTIDTKCETSTGAVNAFRLKKYGKINVIIGPFCDYSLAPIARYSPHWNLPVISPGGMSHNFGLDNKSEPDAEFPLLTRIGVTINELATMIENLFSYYDWKKTSMLYHLNGQKEVTKRFCHSTLDGLVHHFTRVSLEYSHFKFDPNEDEEDDDLEFPEAEIREILTKRVGLDFSIVILCASSEVIREIMIQAAELNFANGEYVFLNIDLFPSGNASRLPWYRVNDTNERNSIAKKGFEALLTIAYRKPDNDEYKLFSKEVKKRAFDEYGKDIYEEGEVNSFVGFYYDAVLLYALALKESIEHDLEPDNGTDITRKMWNRSFKGITGTVSINKNGDRNADYYLMDMNSNTGVFENVAIYYGSKKSFVPLLDKQIYWASDSINPPLDTPKCGFNGSGCPPIESFPMHIYVAIALGTLLLFFSILSIFLFRHYRLEAQLSEINWRINWEDIMFSIPDNKRLENINAKFNKRNSFVSVLSTDSVAFALKNIGNKHIFAKTGYYKSTLVAIKKITKTFNITKPLLIEIKKMRDLQNDHILRFLGVCIDPGNQCIITEYCQKGSLKDVLENKQIKLDNMFKFSLMQDIVRGMSYLHGSEVRHHSNLKSSNCVVDGRFVLKITDFGLKQLREKVSQELDEQAYFKDKLWTAPENLKDSLNNSIELKQKADIYSFSIICHEIIYRNGPFWIENSNLTAKEICTEIKLGRFPYLRPTLYETLGETNNHEMMSIIEKCWSEQPSDRYDFQQLKNHFKRINKDVDRSGNLLDNLLSRMEQYAGNLEGLVEERTSDYLKQKKRAEDLLYMMIPISVAEQLLEGKMVEAVKFESVTIYFSDICGFTQLSAESTPMEVVDLLNDLYTTFDTIIEVLDVYKVETIGDAYMVVSGLPEQNGLLHAREISRMSLKLLNAVKYFKIRHRPNEKLNLRIGIHSGPVCAGIVGRKMPRYCLFGDTVNTASRMESTGLPLKIHISLQTKDILTSFGTFQVQIRGPVYLKGKGEVITYWLLGEINTEDPDISFKV